MTATEPQRDGPRAQFGLRGMLWFVAACSAYCSQLAALPHVAALPHLVDDVELAWRSVATFFVAWLVLGAFLLTKGVQGMIVAHCTAPALALVLAVPMVINRPSAFVQALAIACFVSSLVSFPASVLRMVVVAIRRHFQRVQRGQAATRD